MILRSKEKNGFKINYDGNGTITVARIPRSLSPLKVDYFDKSGNKYHISYESRKEPGSPYMTGSYFISGPDGKKKIDNLIIDCSVPEKQTKLRIGEPSDLAVTIDYDKSVILSAGMSLNIVANDRDGKAFTIKDVRFDGNTSPYIEDGIQTFDTEKLANVFKKNIQDGYFPVEDKKTINAILSEYDGISGGSEKDVVMFHNSGIEQDKGGVWRSAIINGESVNTASLASAERKGSFYKNRSQWQREIYDELKEFYPTKAAKETLQKHIYFKDDIMGYPIDKVKENLEDVKKRARAYFDIGNTFMNITSRIKSISFKTQDLMKQGFVNEKTTIKDLNRITSMAFNLDSNGNYRLVLPDEKGRVPKDAVIIYDDSFVNNKREEKDCRINQMKIAFSNIENTMKLVFMSKEFPGIAKDCADIGADIYGAASLVGVDKDLLKEMGNRGDVELFKDVMNSSQKLKASIHVDRDGHKNIPNIAFERAFNSLISRDKDSNKSQNIEGLISKYSNFYNELKKDKSLSEQDIRSIINAMPDAKTQLSYKEMKIITNCKAKDKVDKVIEYLRTGDADTFASQVRFSNRSHFQKEFNKFLGDYFKENPGESFIEAALAYNSAPGSNYRVLSTDGEKIAFAGTAIDRIEVRYEEKPYKDMAVLSKAVAEIKEFGYTVSVSEIEADIENGDYEESYEIVNDEEVVDYDYSDTSFYEEYAAGSGDGNLDDVGDEIEDEHVI